MLNLAKFVYGKIIKNSDIDKELIDINKEKIFIRKLIKDENVTLSKKNILLLMCILSSIVYEYKHNHNENCASNEINNTATAKAVIFKDLNRIDFNFTISPYVYRI